jgi:CARDB
MRDIFRRTALLGVSLAVSAGGGGTALAGPIGAGPVTNAVPPSRAQLANPVCQQALDPLGRGIAITAVMRPLAANQRLAIQFMLGRRRGRAGPFRPVSSKHLNHWITPSQPHLGSNSADVWRVIGQAAKPSAPAYYRFTVKFRWSDNYGKVIARATRVGPICYQPELRPDLLVGAITVAAVANGKAAYVTHVRNRGLTAAGPFAVELELGPTVVATKTVAGLGPRSSRRVRLIETPCTAGEPVSVIVDPGHQVDEFDRANNLGAIACPLGALSPGAAGP